MVEPVYERDGIRVYHGDNRDVVPALGEQFSAVVTDPPYGLSFMGRDWDHAVPGVAFWQAFRDAMLPGAHLLAFGGTRLWHRLAVAVEDAGFEIKDTLMWLHGQGFPKHKSLLKPAWEPVLLARNPGPGVLQIDACRIGTTKDVPASGSGQRNVYGGALNADRDGTSGFNPNIGRWPPNVILDPDAAAALDHMSGERPSRPGKTKKRGGPGLYEGGWRRQDDSPSYPDGEHMGASRFFPVLPIDDPDTLRLQYQAKSSRRERNSGLDRTLTVKYTVDSKTGSRQKRDSLCAETVRLLQRVTSDIPTVRWHIGESGASITALCHRDSLFTTLTAINRITTSPTSPLWMRSPTSEYTAAANSVTASGGSPAASAKSSSRSAPSTTCESPAASARGAEHVASEMLRRISDADEWQPLTNIHSTVKPLALTRWLLTLVTPPGGVVLDPFAGSGTTGVAAASLGIPCVLIEQESEYLPIIIGRIDHALDQRAGAVLPLFAGVAD